MYCENMPGYFDAEDLYRFAVHEAGDGARFVEASAFLGRSTCFLAETIRASKKRIGLDVVGPFSSEQAAAFLIHLRAAGVEEIVTLRSVLRSKAAELYAPESLDFIFLNAGRPSRAAVRHIPQWYSCVKPGGMLTGYGYSAESHDLMQIVEEHFGADCAVPPRSWAIRKAEDLALLNRLGYQPVMIPSGPPEPNALQEWRQAALGGASESEARLAFEAARFGEAALETLLFLADNEAAEVRLQACGSLAALVTLPPRISDFSLSLIRDTLAILRDDSEAEVRHVAVNAFRYIQMMQRREAKVWLDRASRGEAAERVQALWTLQSLPREIVAQAYRPIPGEGLWDCLDQAQCWVPAPTARAAACVAAVAAAGDSAELETFLTELSQSGRSAGAAVIVFTEESDDACEQVIRRHHALPVRFAHHGCRDASLISLLYSVARVIDADKYLCLNCHGRLPSSLESLFSTLDVLHEETLLVSSVVSRQSEPPAISSLLEGNEKNACEDVIFLTGKAERDLPRVPKTPLFFAGRRQALLMLDTVLRSWQPFASAWINGGEMDIALREDIVFSLAVAASVAAVEMQAEAAGVDPA